MTTIGASTSDIIVLSSQDGGGKKLHRGLVKTARTALAFVSGVLIQSFTIQAWALTHTLVVEIGTFESASPGAIISIENSDGVEIYVSSYLTEGSTNIISVVKPLVGENTVIITLDTNPLSDGTCYVILYLTGI